MSNFPASSVLLKRVAQRLYAARIGRMLFVASLAIAGLYAVLLLVSRLTGLIPDWFTPPMIGLIPLVASVIALTWLRRPTPVDAARRVDEHARTDDLFLTLTMLDEAVGDYKPLVGRDAESKATGIEPTSVISWHWGRPLIHVGSVFGLLLIGTLFVPTLDPFGKVAEAKEAEIRRDELAKSRKATEVRKSQLAKIDSEAETSEDVKKSLEELTADLRRMQPEKRKKNARVLAGQQKGLGEKWRMNAEQLKQLLNGKPMTQRFGAGQRSEAKEWMKQLREGQTDSLDRAMESLLKKLKTANAMADPVERTEAIRRLQKELGELRKFAKEQANSKPLTAALDRAMKQLETMKSGDMSKEATEALSESLKLAAMEAKQLAQNMRDLKALEEALEAIQMAKKLNAEGVLDGEMTSEAQSVGDYAEMYAEMMAALGYDVAMGEEGLDTGGSGLGEGGEVPEDDSVKTDFKDEQTKSGIQKGKILLSLKTKGVSPDDGDELKLEYQAVVKELKKSVSEAIDQEKIPVGYHDGIKKYFDNLDETLAE